MKGIIDHVNLKSFCSRVLARLRIIWSASSKSASVAFKLNQRGLFISLEFSICHNISSLIIIVSIIDGLIALLCCLCEESLKKERDSKQQEG